MLSVARAVHDARYWLFAHSRGAGAEERGASAASAAHGGASFCGPAAAGAPGRHDSYEVAGARTAGGVAADGRPGVVPEPPLRC